MSKERIINATVEYLAKEGGGAFSEDTNAFICVYGSSVYNNKKNNADVDLFCAVSDSEIRDIDVDGLGEFIHDMHIRYGHEVDQEVPYSNKLVYSFSDLSDAVMLQAFNKNSRGSLEVPEIQKTSKFLGSREVKLRLALNALTTPNIIIPNTGKEAARYSSLASIAITAVGISLSERQDCTVNDIIEAVCVSKTNESGEMFLGYKPEHTTVQENLYKIIGRSLRVLSSHGYLIKPDNDPYSYRVNEDFDAFSLMHNLSNKLKVRSSNEQPNN